jgi:hypothetical protein
MGSTTWPGNESHQATDNVRGAAQSLEFAVSPKRPNEVGARSDSVSDWVLQERESMVLVMTYNTKIHAGGVASPP